MKSKSLLFPYFGTKQRLDTEAALESFLAARGKSWLSLSLSYILNELVSNAAKANLKRLFFQKNGLDIKDAKAYAQGMLNFKEALTSDTETYFKLAEQTDSLISVLFEETTDVLSITIKNNSGLEPEEIKRIQEKISNAVHFAGLQDLMLQTMDETEGAGFGLASIILMLRKMGLDETALQLETTPNLTTFQIQVPLSILSEEEQEVIAEAILSEINVIPQFPEHITRLQSLLGNPETNFQEISAIIRKDPALITDILKAVNSAAYGLPKPIANILDAVKYIGIKGLQNLILGYASQNLLMHKYKIPDFEKVMKHSAEVAFFAHHLAQHFGLKNLQENLYISSLLHDIGKILVYAVMKPELSAKIDAFTQKRGINAAITENLIPGYNHSIIGAKMAQKWNFPEALVQSIQFHHVPFEADKPHRNLVSIIYLANTAYYYRRNAYHFSNINPNVLSQFNITTQDAWDKLVLELKNRLSA